MKPSDPGLHVLVDCVDPIADLVAVHGLGADPRSTWVRFDRNGQSKSWLNFHRLKTDPDSGDFVEGTMWLKDLLPKHIPNSRILLFNYKSNYGSNAPKNDIRAIATQLARCLQSEVQRAVDPNRPIVFVAHSFGGLIVEETLASIKEDNLSEVIADATTGVVFLGSPLRGTNTVDWALALVRCGQALGLDSHDGLLVSMNSYSERSTSLLSDFVLVAKEHSIRVDCFYELLETQAFKNFLICLLMNVLGYLFWWLGFSWGKKMIVPKGSACIDGSHCLALDADHCFLNKFGLDDSNFELVKHRLVELIAGTKDQLTDDQKKNLEAIWQAQAPEATFWSLQVSDRLECLPQTREDLLSDIQTWVRSDKAKRILWLSGLAGTGKSTVARTIARQFAESFQHFLGASFFFDRNVAACNNALQFYPTLVADLMKHIPELKAYICQALKERPNIAHEPLEKQFEELLLKPAKKARLKRCTALILIDALDECKNWAHVRSIITHLSSLEAEYIQFRILLTSRPESDISEVFEELSNEFYQRRNLEDELKIKEDIAALFYHTFNNIRHNHPLQRNHGKGLLPATWPKSSDMEKAIEIASPLFIAASTICEFISDRNGNPVERLQDVLDYAQVRGVGIYPIYKQILERLEIYGNRITTSRNIEKFKSIVGPIALLEDPLPRIPLSKFLGVDENEVLTTLRPLCSVIKMPEQDEQPITILHLSFREFLTGSEEAGQFRLNKSHIHLHLAERCIKLLSKHLKRDICDLKQPYSDRPQIEDVAEYLPLEIQYACQFWVHHLEQSGVVVTEGDKFCDFLMLHLLHWLEASSVIGKYEQMIYVILRLEKLVQGDYISLFLYEIRRFTQANRDLLVDQPLQVYYSALLFAPKKSIIPRLFFYEIPRWAQILSGVRDFWSPLEQHFSHPDGIGDLGFKQNSTELHFLCHSGVRPLTIFDGASGDELQSTWISPNISTREVVASALSPSTRKLAKAILYFHEVDLILADRYTGSKKCLLTLSWSKFRTPDLSEWSSSTSKVLLRFSPEEKIIALGYQLFLEENYCFQAWDTKTGQVVLPRLEIEPAVIVSHWEDQAELAYFYDLLVRYSILNNNVILAVRFCGNDLDSNPQSVYLFHENRYELLTTSIDPETPIGGLDCGPASNVLAIWRECQIELWDCDSRIRGSILRCRGTVKSLVFSRNGKSLAIGRWDGVIEIWELSPTHRETAISHRLYLPNFISIDQIVFSPDMRLLASQTTCDIYLWSLRSNYRTELCDQDEFFRRVGVNRKAVQSHDSRYLAQVSYWTRENFLRLRVWDLESGIEIFYYQKQYQLRYSRVMRYSAIHFSPDDRQIAISILSYGVTKIWPNWRTEPSDILTVELPKALITYTLSSMDGVYDRRSSIDMTDSRLLILYNSTTTGSYYDKTLSVWELSCDVWKFYRKLEVRLPEGWLYKARFAKDSQNIVDIVVKESMYRSKVLCWDIDSGNQIIAEDVSSQSDTNKKGVKVGLEGFTASKKDGFYNNRLITWGGRTVLKVMIEEGLDYGNEMWKFVRRTNPKYIHWYTYKATQVWTEPETGVIVLLRPPNAEDF